MNKSKRNPARYRAGIFSQMGQMEDLDKYGLCPGRVDRSGILKGESMKYILLVVLVLSGCFLEPPPDYIAEMHAVYNSVDYAYDPPGGWFQLPLVTRSKGTGDCEDFALLMLDNVWQKYGVAGSFIASAQHAVVEIDGVYYDPTWDIVLPYFDNLALNLTYFEAMLLAAAWPLWG